MLRKIPYSLYSLQDLTTLSVTLSTIAVESHPGEKMLTAAKEKIDEAVKKAKKAMTSGNSSLLTGQVARADDLRDSCYRSLRDHVQAGMARDTYPEYQRACNILWLAFTNNNTLLASLPYREETEALKGLFADLEKFSDELSLINAKEWIDELKEANDNFEKLLDAQTGEDDDALIPTDQEAKAKLGDAIKIFVDVVNSLWGYGQPENIKMTVVRLNETIQKANLKVEVKAKG